MDGFFGLLDTADFPPRWLCGRWTDLHGWTHVVSDVAIFGAYSAIPFVLAIYTYRRRDLRLRPIFWLFCAFIFACGTVHLIEASIFWQPWYRLSALAKVITAVVSWATVIALVRIAPTVARMPGIDQLTAIVDSTEDALIGKGRDGRILSWNAGAQRLYGYTPEEAVGRSIELIVPEDRRGELARINERLRSGRRIPTHETVRRRKDGTLVDVSLTIVPIVDGRGRVTGASTLAHDVSAKKRAERTLRELSRRLEEQALHDPLTGLLNRRGLEQELNRRMGEASREGSAVAALLIDLDDFKAVNDAHGHAAGDEILRAAAQRVARCLRPSDSVARVGGDEFLVLLPHTNVAEARHVAERVRLAVSDATMTASGKAAGITASAGLTAVPEGIVSIEQLLDLTHHGLARSKDEGKNRVAVSHDACSTTPGDAERLLRPESLEVHSQPIRDLRSGEVAGHELLVRGPEGPYRTPDELFRLTVEQNVLTSADLLCFRTCVTRAAAIEDGRIHVNLFPTTLLDVDVERLLELLDEAGGPERFCVELSEKRFLGEPAALKEAVDELKRAGVRVGLDDVGFGRSSIESLVVLEPDVVKIDRVYVHGAAAKDGARRRLERLVVTARCLTGELVAEGLEDAADRDLLIELGVTYAQGFLLGPPTALPDDP